MLAWKENFSSELLLLLLCSRCANVNLVCRVISGSFKVTKFVSSCLTVGRRQVDGSISWLFVFLFLLFLIEFSVWIVIRDGRRSLWIVIMYVFAECCFISPIVVGSQLAICYCTPEMVVWDWPVALIFWPIIWSASTWNNFRTSFWLLLKSWPVILGTRFKVGRRHLTNCYCTPEMFGPLCLFGRVLNCNFVLNFWNGRFKWMCRPRCTHAPPNHYKAIVYNLREQGDDLLIHLCACQVINKLIGTLELWRGCRFPGSNEGRALIDCWISKLIFKISFFKQKKKWQSDVDVDFISIKLIGLIIALYIVYLHCYCF